MGHGLTGGIAIEWVGRKYHTPNGIIRDDQGRILNEEIWHDPAIDDGTNYNVLLDQGATGMLCSLFALPGSAVSYLWMAPGSGTSGAAHGDPHLTYELLGNRVALTNTDGTSPLTVGKVVSLNTFTDNTYTPGYTYYTLAQVEATWTYPANTAGPYQEFSLVSTASSPSTPTTGIGYYLDHYVFSSSVTLSGTSSLVVTASLRLS